MASELEEAIRKACALRHAIHRAMDKDFKAQHSADLEMVQAYEDFMRRCEPDYEDDTECCIVRGSD